MLSTEEFAEWSKKVVLFLHNTSHVEGEPHPNLLKEKGGNGFPTMSYLDAEGNLLLQVGHITPVEQLEEGWQRVQKWKELRAAVDGGDKSKERELFLVELDMGVLTFDQANATFERLSFSDAKAEEIAQKLVNLQFSEILRSTPRGEQAEAGKEFLAMYRAGRIPDSSQETSFWQYMFAHAAAERNVELFEELLGYIKEHRADDPRLQRYLPRLERQLEQLKGG